MGVYTQICWFWWLPPLRFFPHMFKPKVITSKKKTNSKLLERTTVMAATSNSPSQHCQVSIQLCFLPFLPPHQITALANSSQPDPKIAASRETRVYKLEMGDTPACQESSFLWASSNMRHRWHTLSADHHLTGMPLWNTHSWPTPWFCAQYLINQK